MVRVLVLSSLISLSFLMVSTPSAFSQSGLTDQLASTDHPATAPDNKTAPPKLISYQGLLNDKNRPASDGIYSITTTLYSDANGTLAVWSGTYKQRITGGGFSVLLGSGAYPFPTAQDFSKPLWLGVKIDGGEELKPLTQLTGSPYSLSIPDNSVTKDKMAVDYVGSITVNGKQISGKGTTLNLKDGPGTSLLYDEASNSLSLNSSGGIGGNHAPQVEAATCILPWQTTGNNTPSVLAPNTPSCSNIFGFIPPFNGNPPFSDILMVNNNFTQMTMLGNTTSPFTNPPSAAPGNGLMFPTTMANGVGVIFQLQSGVPNLYIHSYGGPDGPTNFFAGNQAGNLSFGFTGFTSPSGGSTIYTNTENTGVGYQALSSLRGITSDNDGVGDPTHPEGAQNTAIGYQALALNTTGWENTASGYWALWKNIDGKKNTATGACALEKHQTGSGNTASGWGAMSDGTSGAWNTGSGVDALKVNTGNFNAAFGTAALTSNTTGSNNTAIGTGAIQTNTIGSNNTASGFLALLNNTTASFNTANGDSALYQNTTGTNNTASGSSALFSNTGGGNNTASGFQALYSNTFASGNTANGFQALYLDTWGYSNTASGFQALYSTTLGNNNTADGAAALKSNTGNDNTASGVGALYSNMGGNDNTASGYEALYSSTGSENTAIGAYTLNSNTSGSYNTALGISAGYSNTTGQHNTLVGYGANTSGAALTNASAIGSGAVVGASNTIELGDAYVTAVSTYGHIVTQSTIASTATAVDGVVVTILGNATATGSDVAGNVIITTSAVGAGTATFNFGTTYGTTPIVMLTPANSVAADLTKTSTVFVTATATGFTVHLTDVANAAPSFNYHVIH